MDTEQNAETLDFFAAFDTGEDSAEEAATAEDTEQNTTETDAADDGVETDATEENADDADEQETGENPADEHSEDDKPIPKDTFEIVTDGKPETVTLEELKTRAQKGGAFDRVKGQLEQSRQRVTALEDELSKLRGIMDDLDFAAKESGVTAEELPKKFFTAYLKSHGGTDSEADAKYRAYKLEKQLTEKSKEEKPAAEDTAKDDLTAKVASDYEDFHRAFPDVRLSDALTDGVKANIQKGMNLLNAYQKEQNDRQAAELDKQRKQLAADKKNQQNRRTSPGSQKTGGGKSGGKPGFFDGFKV